MNDAVKEERIENQTKGEVQKESDAVALSADVDPDQIYQRLKIRKPPKTFTTSPPPPSLTTITPAEEYKKAADSYKKSSDTYKWIAIGLGIFIMYQFYRDN